MRMHYWSCSKFANWLRGTPKPFALTSEGWDAWHADAKRIHPWRYWLAEEGLDIIQDLIHWPADLYYTARHYVNNRFIHKLQYLPTRLVPGKYYESDTRILHGVFETLVDFVEIEKATMSVWLHDDAKRSRYSWDGRSASLGIEYLEWETKLVYTNDILDSEDERVGQPTQQATNAQEILALYRWWKEERPARPDPWEGEMSYGERTALIEKQDQEDDEMLIRLIKIRRGMWT